MELTGWESGEGRETVCFEDQRDMSMFIKTEPLISKKLKILGKDHSWNLLLR